MIGAFIRRMRIDELPQLINVLKGEMGFVGPRPERPHFVDQLAEVIPFYRDRACVKPGHHRLGAGELPLRRLDRGRARRSFPTTFIM